MRYEDINDEQLISMLHESSDDAKDILFEKMVSDLIYD